MDVVRTPTSWVVHDVARDFRKGPDPVKQATSDLIKHYSQLILYETYRASNFTIIRSVSYEKPGV